MISSIIKAGVVIICIKIAYKYVAKSLSLMSWNMPKQLKLILNNLY